MLVIDREHKVSMNYLKPYTMLIVDISIHMTAVLYPLGGCSV